MTLLCAAALAGIPQLAAAAPVEIVVERRPDALDIPADAQLVATVRGAEEAERRTWQLQPGARIELEPGRPWVVGCSGPGIWCPAITVDPLDGSGARNGAGAIPRAELAVYRASEVVGTLRAPRGEALPATGRVQGTIREPAGHPGVDFDAELMVREGRVSFSAPDAPLDLRIAFAGWVPVYRWSVRRAGEGSVVDLGDLALRRGGSLAGWAREERSGAPMEGARVVVVAHGMGEEPASPFGVSGANAEESGFFQVAGLPEGFYRVEVDTGRHAPLVLAPVQVRADAETLLGALYVTPYLTAEVEVEPPVDPDGNRWLIRVRDVGAAPTAEGITATADDGGRARLSGLRPGTYSVRVETSAGSSVGFEEREIATDDRILVELPLVRVEGTVRTDGEPLQALLTLHTGTGDRVELTSDTEGVVSGWMRRPQWPTGYKRRP